MRRVSRLVLLVYITAVLTGTLVGCANKPDAVSIQDSDITVTEIRATSVTINWITSDNSSSNVEYGETNKYGWDKWEWGQNAVTSHSVKLTGLSARTRYHFRVRSWDTSKNGVASRDHTFVTFALPKTARPVFLDVASTGISTSGATITWTTNEPTTSQVEYGRTSDYGSTTPTGIDLVTGHSVSLNALGFGATYHYRLKSKDSLDHEAVSADYTLTTADMQAVDVTLLGGRIVFCERQRESATSGYHCEGAVYAMNASGSGKEKLFDFTLPKYVQGASVAISPDHRRIAYFSALSSENREEGILLVHPMSTGESVEVARCPLKTEDEVTGNSGLINDSSREDLFIAWSPEGTKIAYVIGRDLYTVNADGTGQERLYQHASGTYLGGGGGGFFEDQVRRISWSSDSSRILFDDFSLPHSMHLGETATNLSYRLLQSADAITGTLVNLHPSAAIVCSRPNSNELLVQPGLLMNDDGSNERVFPRTDFLDEGYQKVSYSPDGTTILAPLESFTLDPKYRSHAQGGLQLVDADTGDQITEVRGYWQDNEASSLTWSPDSQYLIVSIDDSRAETSPVARIVVFDRDLASNATLCTVDAVMQVYGVGWLP